MLIIGRYPVWGGRGRGDPRLVGHAIKIGSDICVRILEIDQHGQVKVGIDAPRDVKIMRDELGDA